MGNSVVTCYCRTHIFRYVHTRMTCHVRCAYFSNVVSHVFLDADMWVTFDMDLRSFVTDGRQIARSVMSTMYCNHCARSPKRASLAYSAFDEWTWILWGHEVTCSNCCDNFLSAPDHGYVGPKTVLRGFGGNWCALRTHAHLTYL